MAGVADILARATEAEAFGKPDEAAALYRAVLAKFPKHKAARENLARIAAKLAPNLDPFLQKGMFEQVLALGAPHADVPEVANTMGIAAAQLDRPKEALGHFARALSTAPKYPQALVNRASVYRSLGQNKAALADAEAAAALVPDQPDVLVNLALSQEAAGQPEEALATYEATLALAPDHAGAHIGLCLSLERASDIPALAEALEAATQAVGEAPALTYLRAELHWRQGEAKAALALCQSLAPDDLPPGLAPRLHQLHGRAADDVGEPAEAFASFTAMNARLEKTALYGPGPANPYAKRLTALARTLPNATPWTQEANSEDKGGIAPIFLVGFPRSGTTLTDTLLRGHPDLALVEEAPFVSDMATSLGDPRSWTALAKLSSAKRSKARGQFRAAFETALGAPLGPRRPVDKMPLNLGEAALIQRVFPEAQFILVLRHPADCVLSCYMQAFRSSAAMDLMLRLESAAALYDQVMGIWSETAARLELSVLTLRFEDLTQNPEAAARHLCAGLGLPFAPAMLDTERTAKTRARIKTPSYRQVTEAIHTRPVDRWRRYEAQLAPIMPILSPWIAKWGYGGA